MRGGGGELLRRRQISRIRAISDVSESERSWVHLCSTARGGVRMSVSIGRGHRVRMSTADGHYAGGLVDGARIVQLFGDAVTEMADPTRWR